LQADTGNIVPQLCVDPFDHAEWDLAMNQAKRGKACAGDDINNEHMLGLDGLSRPTLFRAFDDVIATSCEPRSWKARDVVMIEKTSTKDSRKLEQCRGLSLTSCPSKVFRQALANRSRVVMRAALRDTQGAKHRLGCTHNGLLLTQLVGERLERGLITHVCPLCRRCQGF